MISIVHSRPRQIVFVLKYQEMLLIVYRPSTCSTQFCHSFLCLVKEHPCSLNLILHKVSPFFCHLCSKYVIIGKPCLCQIILW
jgi:hypothetical protein